MPVKTARFIFYQKIWLEMNKIKYILLVILIQSFALNAQFIQNNSRSLFSDVKAFQENDAVTVLIIEDTQAGNSAATASGRSSNIGAGIDVNSGSSSTNIDAGLDTRNDYEGSGNTIRKEKIRTKLSARVIEIVDNGNLRIEGTRTTKINGETSTVTITGIVRPVDIHANNSVYSYDIMDLSIIIDGEGIITEQQEPGLLTKFLRILF